MFDDVYRPLKRECDKLIARGEAYAPQEIEITHIDLSEERTDKESTADPITFTIALGRTYSGKWSTSAKRWRTTMSSLARPNQSLSPLLWNFRRVRANRSAAGS